MYIPPSHWRQREKTAMCKRNPLRCILPPNVLEGMTEAGDPKRHEEALENLITTTELRTAREVMPRERTQSLFARPSGKVERKVFDLKKKPAKKQFLPGTLVRSEGDPPSNDPAVDEAYDYSGVVYDFYFKVFGRHSLDNQGMPLISSVHAKTNSNAVWDGRQIAYGDGDGQIFNSMTSSLDVVGHEFTHGVVDFGPDLVYEDEPGALNEHFADVFGSMIKQWSLKQDVKQASWLIGEEIITSAPTRQALRSLKAPGTAFKNDPMGDDQQRNHYSKRYKGDWDSGGIHINSGIPNRAFFLAASAMGGFSWKKAGPIWYDAMIALHANSLFRDAKEATLAAADKRFGTASTEKAAVEKAWTTVGV